MTSYPLRAILHNSNATGNIAMWAAELAEFQLDFQPLHAVKSQMGMDVAREGDTACTLRESRVEMRVYPSLGEVLGCGEGNGDS